MKNAPSTATAVTTQRNILQEKQTGMIPLTQTRGNVYLCRRKIISTMNRLVFIFFDAVSTAQFASFILFLISKD